MEDQESLIESLFKRGEQYGRTTIELLKLKTLDKSADVASIWISWIVVIAFAVLFFLFLNIGLALWIGELLGKSYYGFFAIAGFYALITLIFGIFREHFVKKPVNNCIVTHLLD